MKIDCSITKNFLKERDRMQKEAGYVPYYNHNKAEEMVQAWSDAHPQKTYLTDFLSKYPNAPLKVDGTPRICPYHLGYVKESDCPGDSPNKCVACWNRELCE